MACETKAAEWAERQQDAAGEMGAIAKAKEILATGVKAFVQVASKTRVVDEDDDVQDDISDRFASLVCCLVQSSLVF